MTDWFARPVLHVTNVVASLRFYSNPGPKLMQGKRIVSSLYLSPGQASAETSSGFYVQQSGIISVQRQCT
ncbi:hypothetical protein BDD14_5598 [Edaphobacter modestus]|uniref:Uncharacterized protein n=1 Tax=Edaphobacter modestus TaxID=388466 RepID=A0A4Q7YGN1_9BACT|nr:hypothetical protein BDD14_5598 [Edaphobacter modestus]